MKTSLSLLFIASVAGATSLAADSNDIEALKRELRELRTRTEQLEKRLQDFESAPKQLQAQTQTNALPRVVAQSEQDHASDPAKIMNKPWSPTDPITLLRSKNAYLNIGFDAMVNFGWSTADEPSDYLNLGDHDPIQNGFSMRNAEITLEGAVDPYFSAFGVFLFKLDQDNATEIELEELYAKTTSLPGGLQLKAGHFFANFGRQNTQHPHSWAFVDQPLVLNRVLGPEGLRNPGAEVSWLAPLPFFTELSLGVFNGKGEQAFLFRNAGDDDAGVNRFRGRETNGQGLDGGSDLLFVPRLASSFELTPSQTLVAGTSAAIGPNDTGEETRTEIYGADLYWKWKSTRANKGFPFVSFQAEGLYGNFEAAEDLAAPVPLPEQDLRDYGFYSQILWGFRPQWVAGLRGEWVDGNESLYDPEDVFRNERYRVSPNLTWYPTEFTKVRLQYNYDRGELFGHDHSVWLQLEFQLGAHAPHKF